VFFLPRHDTTLFLFLHIYPANQILDPVVPNLATIPFLLKVIDLCVAGMKTGSMRDEISGVSSLRRI
jgi:hypothetical protein